MDFRISPRGDYTDHTPPRRPVPAQPPEPPAPRKRAKRPALGRKWLKILLALIIVAGIAWLAYGYINTKNQLEKLSSSGSSAGQTETEQLVDKVGKLVDLPTGETPTIATVNNAAKLKTQTFFANAQDGDKVIIYSKAARAILYRPSNNKIIEYRSNVNLGASTP